MTGTTGCLGLQMSRIADDVHATYRFRRRHYRDEVNAGFDAESRIFWMRRDRRSKLRTLYEAVAKQLIFTSQARPIDLLAIERALEIQVNDPSYGRPTDTQVDAIYDDIHRKGQRSERGYRRPRFRTRRSAARAFSLHPGPGAQCTQDHVPFQ